MTPLQNLDPDDRELYEQFRAARRADRAETPRFRVASAGAARRPAWRSVSFLRVAGATLGACALAVLASSPFVLNDVLDAIEPMQEVARPRKPARPRPPAPAAETETETLKKERYIREKLKALGYSGDASESNSQAEEPAPAPAVEGAPSEDLAARVASLEKQTAALQATKSEPELTGEKATSGPSPLPTAQAAPPPPRKTAENAQERRKNIGLDPRAARGLTSGIAGGVVGVANSVASAPLEPEPYRVQDEGFSAESYARLEENPFRSVADHPLSTFSADVDTASYTNVRRFLREGRLPPVDAVRIEELVNYFRYDYKAPRGNEIFAPDVEVADCPWNSSHRLARIGIRAREVERTELAGTNLVFLVDVSGSMEHPAKLPLLKQGLRMLAGQLEGRDSVAMVVYAGNSGLVLPPTPGSARGEIMAAIDNLEAGGSTNGGAGIDLAYRIARENFVRGGVNRVILATDGDFNVGVSSPTELIERIRRDARHGVFLSVLGFGTDNYKDDRLERLADEGNGQYAYIDSMDEARRVLVEQVGGTLVTVAKDVKFQVEFNPARVAAYRLIGYENRMLSKEDFNDDAKDAGEVGSGHTVTALYELVPAGQELGLPTVDPLRYQSPPPWSEQANNRELFTLKIRYKEPEAYKSVLRELQAVDEGTALAAASEDFHLASAAALFGMLLRNSPHTKLDHIVLVRSLLLLEGARGEQEAELLRLLDAATPLLVERARSANEPW